MQTYLRHRPENTGQTDTSGHGKRRPAGLRSLLGRLGLLMATITALALISMASSILLAQMLKGEAGAINEAGALRKQAYRMTAELLAARTHDETLTLEAAWDDYDRALTSPRVLNMLPQTSDDPLLRGYEQVVKIWRTRQRVEMQDYLQKLRTGSTSTDMHTDLLIQTHTFVDTLDSFVQQLEQDAEGKVRALRLVQGISVLLTLIVVLLTMYFMQMNVLVPLRDLLACAQRTRHGDFGFRALHTGPDELGQLGEAFNVMADDLSKIYAELEERVREKTRRLRDSNLSLSLLYNATTHFNDAVVEHRAYARAIENIGKELGFNTARLCLPANHRSMELAALTPGLKTRQLDATFIAAVDGIACALPTADAQTPPVLIPLASQGVRHGLLMLTPTAGQYVPPWQLELLATIGTQLSASLTNAQRLHQQHRVELLEERAGIARELHDSIAQSLAYLQIQVTLLRTLIQQPAESARIETVTDELRRVLNQVYDELRGLITTFRSRLDDDGMESALKSLINEFRTRSETKLNLDMQIAGCQLHSHEQLHMLQIIREALTNVAQHAQASEASLKLRCMDNGMIEAEVVDNGIGLDPLDESPRHYGLVIMRERAAKLHGELHLEPLQRGTLVRLRFRPHTDSRHLIKERAQT